MTAAVSIGAGLALPALAAPAADAATLLVVRQDGTADFTTITTALAAADPFDTIEVADAGPYRENLLLYRNAGHVRLDGLTLRAAQGVRPVIDGGWDGEAPGGPCRREHPDGSTVKVYDADGVTIEGFEIVNASGGVDQAGIAVMQTVDRLTIRDNVIHTGRNDGIQFADACATGPYREVVVEDNEIFGFDADEIDDGAACVKLQDAFDVTIRGNDIHHCDRGIVADRGHTFAVVGADIEHNRIHHMRHTVASTGLPGPNDEAVKIDDRSRDVRIHRNEIWANDDNGIRLDDDVNDVEITHNTLWGNGAELAGLDDLSAAGLLVEDGSHDVRVLDNIVTASKGDGILVANTTLGDSTFDHNNVFANGGLDYRDRDPNQADRFVIEGPNDTAGETEFHDASAEPDANFGVECHSAAIDAGTDAGRGEPHLGAAPDIGAFEMPCPVVPHDCSTDGLAGGGTLANAVFGQEDHEGDVSRPVAKLEERVPEGAAPVRSGVHEAACAVAVAGG